MIDINDISIEVSVIMSVYKEPLEWISKSIESILSQTFDKFEFIIVNDNPDRRDNAFILEKYSKIDRRIRILTNDKNRGLIYSLNKALSESRGKFIARMDADDISLSDRLQTQYEYMRNNPDVDLCSGRHSFIDENDNVIREEILPENVDVSWLFRTNPFVHSTVFFKSAIKDIRTPLYSYDYVSAEDIELWQYLVIKGKTLKILDKHLLRYRLSSQQITQMHGGESNKNAQKARLKFLKGYLELKGFVDKTTNLSLKEILFLVEDVYVKSNQKDLYLRNILFSLYYSLATYSIRIPLRYLFNRHLLIKRFSLIDSYHILTQFFYKNETPFLIR